MDREKLNPKVLEPGHVVQSTEEKKRGEMLLPGQVAISEDSGEEQISEEEDGITEEEDPIGEEEKSQEYSHERIC
ncbi:hypothetical protein AVEN_83028-1 [Araneus ventricosus]|uniref:Uncharacterized protein n=1 Tax=Araneus ventricosus TaxID=182803 RepID=A0A4Y2IRG1_ARAVE|nr:hypothetical protein AVEN_83028-1 [Araneus ventricosus]